MNILPDVLLRANFPKTNCCAVKWPWYQHDGFVWVFKHDPKSIQNLVSLVHFGMFSRKLGSILVCKYGFQTPQTFMCMDSKSVKKKLFADDTITMLSTL